MSNQEETRYLLCSIARTAFGVVCSILEDDQNLTSSLRSESSGSNQISREEEITTAMLRQLKKTYASAVHIEMFDPSEEAKNGADWYWRIDVNSVTIHALVQAKRVKRRERGQRDEDGYINIEGEQIKTLINAGKRQGTRLTGLQTWVASYMRHTANPPCGRHDLNACPIHHHSLPCIGQQASVWIGQARDFGRDGVYSGSQVVQNSLRLDCLLPCFNSHPTQRGPASKGFIPQSGIPSFEICADILKRDPEQAGRLAGVMHIAA